MSNILHMMVGLPRSGKSTLAISLGYPIVEPDAIRKSLGCYPFNPSMEKLVWCTADLMVKSLFNAGHTDVILDAVNHTKNRRSIWESQDWCIRLHEVKTSKDTCVERAISTKQDYLIPIIERMSSSFEWVMEEDS